MARRKSFTRQLWEEQRNKRERRLLEQARERHDLAVEREERQQRRDRQREREAADRRKRDLAHNHSQLVEAVAGGDTGVVGDTVQAVLVSSKYPAIVPVECRVHYKPEAGELLIDCELPRHDVIPAVTSYRYIKTTKELRPTAFTEADRKRRYGQLIARIVLRIVREALDATPPAIVGTVTTNAHVSAVHTATGRPIRPCLVSVMAERDEFDQLHLDAPELDPQRCLRYLNAIVSPHPYDLEAVRPVAIRRCAW